jgi:ADP-ribose pyrophosphatase YjhB (NUDIX family)
MKTAETPSGSSLEFDSFERPLHPWEHCRDSLPEGKGSFYHWGPNYTVDPIVMTNNSAPSMLLIKRGDNGMYALPGGFIDDNEDTTAAAKRELGEETHYEASLDLPCVVYKGPVEDHRSTRNAWPETTALLWQVDDESTVVGDDDATIACWIPLRELRRINKFHGSHRALIEMAITEHGTPLQKMEYFSDDTEFTIPSGGHMGYDRTVATLPTAERFFVKSHNPSHFTDKIREAHSRLYLEKEYHVYESLRDEFPFIPRNVTLHNDTALSMEAYDARDGWLWRIPTDSRRESMKSRSLRAAS